MPRSAGNPGAGAEGKSMMRVVGGRQRRGVHELEEELGLDHAATRRNAAFGIQHERGCPAGKRRMKQGNGMLQRPWIQRCVEAC